MMSVLATLTTVNSCASTCPGRSDVGVTQALPSTLMEELALVSMHVVHTYLRSYCNCYTLHVFIYCRCSYLHIIL